MAYLGLVAGSCPWHFREGVCGLKVVLGSNFVLKRTKKREKNKKEKKKHFSKVSALVRLL